MVLVVLEEHLETEQQERLVETRASADWSLLEAAVAARRVWLVQLVRAAGVGAHTARVPMAPERLTFPAVVC